MNMIAKLRCEPEVTGQVQSLRSRHNSAKGVVRAFRPDKDLVQRYSTVRHTCEGTHTNIDQDVQANKPEVIAARTHRQELIPDIQVRNLGTLGSEEKLENRFPGTEDSISEPNA